MSDLEQYSCFNNIKVKAAPTAKGESCVSIVPAIGDKIGCPVSAGDLDTAHRVPAKKDTNIIARFLSIEKKIEFVGKARKARFTAVDIGLTQSSDHPVYVNDHLTPERKRLFAQALPLKKEKR